MTHRREADHYGAHRPTPAEQTKGTMFDAETGPRSAPGWVSTWSTLTKEQQAAQRDRWKELLLPVVRELARKAGPEGIIAADVISAGIVGGILWGEHTFLSKYQRIYAWVGPWLGALVRQGELAPLKVDVPGGGQVQVSRRSERDLSHGTKQGVFVAAGRAA